MSAYLQGQSETLKLRQSRSRRQRWRHPNSVLQSSMLMNTICNSFPRGAVTNRSLSCLHLQTAILKPGAHNISNSIPLSTTTTSYNTLAALDPSRRTPRNRASRTSVRSIDPGPVPNSSTSARATAAVAADELLPPAPLAAAAAAPAAAGADDSEAARRGLASMAQLVSAWTEVSRRLTQGALMEPVAAEGGGEAAAAAVDGTVDGATTIVYHHGPGGEAAAAIGSGGGGAAATLGTGAARAPDGGGLSGEGGGGGGGVSRTGGGSSQSSLLGQRTAGGPLSPPLPPSPPPPRQTTSLPLSPLPPQQQQQQHVSHRPPQSQHRQDHHRQQHHHHHQQQQQQRPHFEAIITALKLALASLQHAPLRRDGRPPATRAVQLASTLADLCAAGLPLDAAAMCAGVVSEAADLGALRADVIRAQLGPEVAALVHDMLRVRQAPRRIELLDDEGASAVREWCLAFHDVRSCVVEVVGWWDELQHLGGLPLFEQQAIALETLQIGAPLGHALGLGPLSAVMEDMCLKVLFPESYTSTSAWLRGLMDPAEDLLFAAQQRLLSALDDHPDFGKLSGGLLVKARTKSLFSVMKKLLHLGDMARGGRSREELYDLLGMRAIVKPPDFLPPPEAEAAATKACYIVQDVACKLWRPIPSRSKDYIVTPKPNGYQSIHLTLQLGQLDMSYETYGSSSAAAAEASVSSEPSAPSASSSVAAAMAASAPPGSSGSLASSSSSSTSYDWDQTPYMSARATAERDPRGARSLSTAAAVAASGSASAASAAAVTAAEAAAGGPLCVELQIRTAAMDLAAESGDAAHAVYKGGLDARTARQLQAWTQELQRRLSEQPRGRLLLRAAAAATTTGPEAAAAVEERRRRRRERRAAAAAAASALAAAATAPSTPLPMADRDDARASLPAVAAADAGTGAGRTANAAAFTRIPEATVAKLLPPPSRRPATAAAAAAGTTLSGSDGGGGGVDTQLLEQGARASSSSSSYFSLSSSSASASSGSSSSSGNSGKNIFFAATASSTSSSVTAAVGPSSGWTVEGGGSHGEELSAAGGGGMVRQHQQQRQQQWGQLQNAAEADYLGGNYVYDTNDGAQVNRESNISSYTSPPPSSLSSLPPDPTSATPTALSGSGLGSESVHEPQRHVVEEVMEVADEKEKEEREDVQHQHQQQQELHQHQLSEAQRLLLFSSLGSLDEVEEAPLVIGLGQRDAAAAAEQLFRHLDVNGDGRLSLDEVRQALTDLAVPSSERDAAALLAALDRNGDGGVSVEEFVEGFGRGLESRQWGDQKR